MSRNIKYLYIALVAAIASGCTSQESGKKIVLAIPVYGQSLALGEEAERITDFDTLATRYKHRIVTENLDGRFGYLSDTHLKQWIKRLLNDRRRAFELSIYGMSEMIANHVSNKENGGEDTIICTFVGGRGATGINELGKGSSAYTKFMDELRKAHRKALRKGWDFSVPAICWMQGENDLFWNTSENYREDLKNFHTELNNDIKSITGQNNDVFCIIYQTNCLTSAENFDANQFECIETSIPQGQMELIRDDSLFLASGPTYPYTFVNDWVHIDGLSQKRLGFLAGLSAIRLLESNPSNGLVPSSIEVVADTVLLKFETVYLPLVLDTLAVEKAKNYGFSIIDSTNIDILTQVTVKGNTVKLLCSANPKGAKVRYAVNGIPKKNGHRSGPRGNLRDSQGELFSANILRRKYPLHNWCYQFDELVK